MINKIAILTVQRWGNSFAIRIPIQIARHAHVKLGTPVEISLQEIGIVVRPIGEKKMTLDERLALFDPEKHRGEVMISEQVGVEKF